MTLPYSGTMAISMLKAEWTASANELSRYYRGGGIVPSQRPGGTYPGNPKPGNTVPGNPKPCAAIGWAPPASHPAQIYMNNSTSNGDPNKGKYVARTNWPGGWCGAGPNGAPDPTTSYTNSRSLSCCHGKWAAGSINGTAPSPFTGQASNGFNPPGTNPPTTNPPTTNPPTTSPPTAINAPIPTAGTISLGNFYGGTK